MLRHHGAPPAMVALDLVAQVASGLADAHAAGMVHRDIKPANVLLRRRGATMAAYLGDFGISRRLHAGDPEDDRTGTVGTPSYMAPELHTGGTAGVASDVYALGCLLWATLSGRAPYRGADGAGARAGAPRAAGPAAGGRLAAGDRGQPDPAHGDGEGPGRALPVGRRCCATTSGAPRTLSPTAPPSGVRRAPLLVAGAVAAVVLVAAAIAWGVTRDQPVARSVDRPVRSRHARRPIRARAPAATTRSVRSPRPTRAPRERSLADALLGQGLLTRGAGRVHGRGVDRRRRPRAAGRGGALRRRPAVRRRPRVAAVGGDQVGGRPSATATPAPGDRR